MALVNVIPDLGGSFAYLLRVGPRARLGIARGQGSASGSIGAAAALLLVEGGEGEIHAGSVRLEVAGRDDVFDGPGWSVLIAPKTRIAIRGNLRYSIVGRAATGDRVETRVIAPDEVTREMIGDGHADATVITYLSKGPLRCGEVVSAPGSWAGWPPHRHASEQLKLFRFDPPTGVGVQISETKDGGQRAEVLRDGEAVRIRSGPHPSVSTPDATMYCLWVEDAS
jgi:5-deoxy-D-glucuronate isomerase